MSWRVAQSLETLLHQINERWPDRKKDSDGGIGDAAHATRNSDHNPWVKDGAVGVVTARDFTNDPATGPDSGVLAETLRLSQDPRIKYIISNKRIANHEAIHGEAAWAWRPYFGLNDHTHHVHISVLPDKAQYDDVTPWTIETKEAT